MTFPPRCILVACVALVVLSTGVARAQDREIRLGPDLVLEPSGAVQPRMSYGVQRSPDGDDTRVGIGLRRARIQVRVTYLDRLGFEYDVDTAPGDVRSVDLFGFYALAEGVEIRAGRLPPAQPRAYIPTSFSETDVVDRAAIAERWAAGTIGSSGRDFGASVEVEREQYQVEVTLHNGTGAFSREQGNFRESPAGESVTRGTDQTGLALSALARLTPAALPGVEIGAFVGANGAGSENTALMDVERTYTTAAAHAYWGARPGSQPVRLKADVLGIRYETVGGQRQRSAGASALAAVRVLRHAEAFARAERFWSDVDADGESYYAAGLSYSLSAARGRNYREVRLTAAYTYRDSAAPGLGGLGSEGREDAHLAVLQAQFAF